MSYIKLFGSLITSTIWTEDDKTRIVWITMLAMADRHGEVQGTIPGLARIAAVPIEDCRRALDKFMAPDPDSRTPDEEGRRVEKIDGGWLLINHRKYREMASRDDAKTMAALRQARHRERKKRNAAVTHSNAPVTPAHASITPTLHIAEAEAVQGGASAPPPPPSACPVIEAWNLIWGTRIQATPTRRKLIAARLKNEWKSLEWRTAIQLTRASAYCCGQNDRGWRATIDWFLRPDTATKMLEREHSKLIPTDPTPSSTSEPDKPSWK